MGDSGMWAAVAVGCIATLMWRFLGVVVETKVRADSPLFLWIGAVAYAMVAGLMARVMLFPGGDMTVAPMIWRIFAFGVGFAVWYWRDKSVPWGLFAGVGTYGAVSALGL